MSQPQKTQDEWTIHALNIHGAFFERKCATVVRDLDNWEVVARNYPVEYPVSDRGGVRGKDSAVDIRARSEPGEDGFVHELQIECKKANPEFVNWIFFPAVGTPARLQVATNSIVFGDDTTRTWSVEPGVVNSKTNQPIASDAREVRGNYLTYKNQGDKTKTSNAAIQDAAYQVALANRAIHDEDLRLLLQLGASGTNQSPNWTRKTYLPMIVTTARLFNASFDDEYVSLETGEIPLDSVQFSEVDTVIYQYPVPKHFQHSLTEGTAHLEEHEPDAVVRMSIFVVRATALAKFLVGLRK